MNETQPTTTTSRPDVDIAREHTKQASVVGWTAGLSVFFSVPALFMTPEWPVAAGVAALAAMVAFVCRAILNRR